LAAAGDLKVLVDALFDKPNPEYRAPAPEVLEKIMKGATPFDGVDLVLVTHNHPDHFEARLAVRYLETLPEPNCARFLQEVLKPDHIALTHLPVRLEGDALGKIGQVREFYKDIFLLLSGMPAKVFQK
jgi:glyoxylase-like metal-dependent hydrolase (beta-lactamase superfamily II)